MGFDSNKYLAHLLLCGSLLFKRHRRSQTRGDLRTLVMRWGFATQVTHDLADKKDPWHKMAAELLKTSCVVTWANIQGV